MHESNLVDSKEITVAETGQSIPAGVVRSTASVVVTEKVYEVDHDATVFVLGACL